MKSFEEMSFDEKIEEAQRRVDRKARGLPIQETPAELAARIEEEDRRLEKEIQHDMTRTLIAYGFKVYNFSQPRATKQSSGIPDAIAIHPWRRQLVFLEVKTPDGVQSEPQRDFQILIVQLAIVTVQYLLGGVKALEEYLISIGAAERTLTGAIEPVQRRL